MLRQMTPEDLGKEAGLNDLKEKLIEMACALTEFCDKNGLRYYLSGGTLLGAVRHKGFIPWDDDIDLNMPRPDCEKLQELCGGLIGGKYVLQRPDPSACVHSECWRLYDYSLIIENNLGGTSKKPFLLPVFIDIFPIEGLPEDDKKLKSHYRKIKINRLFMYSGLFNAWKGRTLTRKIIHILIRPVSKLFGVKRFYNNIQKLGMKYPFDECEYIGVVTAPVHTIEERVKKAEYIPQVDVDFEGKIFKAPKNYDTYLTQLYGPDYMQIPPKEKQRSHHGFKLYFNKDQSV